MTFPLSMPRPEELRSSVISHPLSGDAISPAYINTIQLLIEKCLLFNLDREECISSIEKHAKVKPAITRIVWDELEKANKEFFTAYYQRQSRSSSSQSYTNTSNDYENLDRALIEATQARSQQ